MFTTTIERVATIWITQYEITRKDQWKKRLAEIESAGLPMTIKKSWRDDGYTDAERTDQGVVIVEALESDLPTIIRTINSRWKQAMSCQCSEVIECQRQIELVDPTPDQILEAHISGHDFERECEWCHEEDHDPIDCGQQECADALYARANDLRDAELTRRFEMVEVA